ncbi:MAG: hypothetical protein J6W31_05960 [Clostridia bacterium]|nr:hypothetical protein [Clostridia bacterium]
MNAAHIVRGVNEFIDTELAPSGASLPALDQFLFGLKLGIAKRKAESVVAGLIEGSGKAIGVVDSEGNVDIDTVYHSALDAIRRVDSIDISGFKFREADINKLYGLIKKGG